MVGLIGRSGASPQDFQNILESVGEKVDAKKIEVDAKIEEAWRAMENAPPSPAKAKWLDAIAKKNGVDKAFYSLLDEVEPVKMHDLEIASREQKQLGQVLRSFQSLAGHLRELNARGDNEPINPVLAKDQHGLRSSLISDVQAVRDALRAAGDKVKEVGAFPLKQLGLIEAKAEIDAAAILKERKARLDQLPQDPTAGAAQLATVHGAATQIGKLLGDKEVGAALIAAADKVPGPEKAAFLKNLAAFARMVDVASTALDYSTLGAGWGVGAGSRVEYRTRSFDDWNLYASESRLDATQGRLLDTARDIAKSDKPAAALGEKLVANFLIEIGVDAKSAQGWKVSAQNVATALEHEALLPLRALNETIGDVPNTRRDAAGLGPQLKKVVSDVTRHVLEGDYREWRYTSPQSTKQLAVLSDKQRDQWKTGFGIESDGAGGAKLKTREEDGIELMWVTKIGGPSHGFDLGPACLLPLLANGRTKAILVEDDRWPHNAAARCYLRVLQSEDGKPMLYLEPPQRDFPHKERFDRKGTEHKEWAAVRFAQVSHALEKAEQMGLPLNLSASDDAVLDALGVKYAKYNHKLVIEGSAGVFEASDTMFRGHDFPQMEKIVAEPQDLRIMVKAPAAKAKE